MSTLTRILGLATFLVCAALPAHAADPFPQKGKVLRIISPLSPGGSSDVQARAIANKLSQQLGIPVMVENKPGASTGIAVRELMRSPADGYTVLYTITVTTSQLPHLYEKPPFDVFKDMTPVGVAARTRTILVATPKAPYSTLKELVSYAKANPGKINYGSYGLGSSGHVNGELLKANAGIDIVHVPYKGSTDAVRDLLAGQIQFVFDGPSTAISNAKGGLVKILGVADKERLPAIPDVPTLTEAGVAGIDLPGLEQFFVPVGTPKEIVNKLNSELMKAVRSPEVSDMYVRGGSTVVASTPEEHARMMREDSAQWGTVMRRLNIRAD
ncbi:Bug family tripartite tricarboxylate transporter substrate binding protein [Ottowia thiooxydans]|uniref:Bug family tripartite tricarboxylate transporter substrate binding protein n=1 Tax=Ottowia thiooxydans TaxID=219182 RepID=UPI0003F76DB7|nr:tripartite tricarboxylate transporter substrate binding protein [Ottowia thiooxydans]